MKLRLLICLLLPIFLTSISCTQHPEEKKAKTEQKSRGNAASVNEQPVRVHYLTGDIISISPKANHLVIRGKDGDVRVFINQKTIIKSGSDNSKLSELSSGNRVMVRYISIKEKNIAKSIFVAQENREELESPKSENVPVKPQGPITPPEPQKVITPVQPSIVPEKQWPSS